MPVAEPEAVCVAYVHDDTLSYSWHASVNALWRHSVLKVGRPIREMAMYFATSQGIHDARTKTVAQFLAGDVGKWLLWLDTDMGFEHDLLERLLAVADKVTHPVVGALCFAQYRNAPDGSNGFQTFAVPTIYDWAETPDGAVGFTPRVGYERGALVRCDATGSAAILIHRSVFERMAENDGQNWYSPIPNPMGGVFGEDMSFCIRLVELDIPLHVHTGVKTTHHKHVWVGEDRFDLERGVA